MPELNREQIALLETLIQSEVDGTGAGEHIDRIRRPDGRLPEHDRYGALDVPRIGGVPRHRARPLPSPGNRAS